MPALTLALDSAGDSFTANRRHTLDLIEQWRAIDLRYWFFYEDSYKGLGENTIDQHHQTIGDRGRRGRAVRATARRR